MTKLKLKRIYVFFTSAFIFLLHLPFVFAKTSKETIIASKKVITERTVDAVKSAKEMLMDVYDSMNLASKGLSEDAFEDAVNGYVALKAQGKVGKSNIISIADFSKSSSTKRLFVIDLQKQKILFNTYVAHGQNSGQEYAKSFSNTPESLMSSPGFYVTSDTYEGGKGFSLHLNGMERGINDKAYERSIVMHAADYVNEGYIQSQGYIGRSWGCPAVAPALNKPIINTIKGGSVFFIYTTDKGYQSKSRLIAA